MRESLREAAQNVCIDAIRTAPPGELVVRRLDGASALNEAEIVRIRVPRDRTCENPFAPHCKEELNARAASLDSARAAAVERVRDATARPGSRTDLVGALAGAAMTFQSAPPDAERRLIIVSDLRGNVNRDASGLRLKGLQVLAVVQCSADVASDRQVQEEFRALVTAAGAVDVTILALSPNTP